MGGYKDIEVVYGLTAAERARMAGEPSEAQAFEQLMRGWGEALGAEPTVGARAAARVASTTNTWSHEALLHLSVYDGVEPGAVPAFLMHLGVLLEDSVLVSDEARRLAHEDNVLPIEVIEEGLESAACNTAFSRRFPKTPGLTDEEIAAWSRRIAALPRGVVSVLEATWSAPEAAFFFLHLLGISDRGLPSEYSYGDDHPELRPPLAEDEEPLTLIRKALWVLQPMAEPPDAAAHMRVEAAVARIARHPEAIVRSVARWVDDAPVTLVEGLLRKMGALDADSPMVSEEGAAAHELPLVRHPRGRFLAAHSRMAIEQCIDLDEWGVTGASYQQPRLMQQRLMERRIYNGLPFSLRPLVAMILDYPKENLHLAVACGLLEVPAGVTLEAHG